MLNKKELSRYSRHILLPEVGSAGQEKLKAAKVLVIGAGGLGCPVLQYLSAAGIGTIGIIDFDVDFGLFVWPFLEALYCFRTQRPCMKV